MSPSSAENCRKLVLLQNTYVRSAKYHRTRLSRPLWERLLKRSVSWRRLSVLEVSPADVDNVNPLCGDSPRSRLPADYGHVRDLLVTRNPELVIACGRVAEECVKGLWDGPLLALPHPAHYPAQKAYDAASRILKRRFGPRDRIAYRTPNAYQLTLELLSESMTSEHEKYDWPLICLTRDTVREMWYPTLYVMHPHQSVYQGAYRYRLKFCRGFETRGCAEAYVLKEFLPNVDRHAKHVVQLRLDVVFEWDGEGEPDPGPWRFDY